jgi:iron complex transport system substrate-binding protein
MSETKNKPLRWAVSFLLLSTILIFILYQVKRDRSIQPLLSQTPGQSRPLSYQRIICATPSITEIVFALGLGDRVVGVSDFSFYPPEAKEITRIGGLFNPSTERILSLKPDLIIFQGKHEKLARYCQEQRIQTLAVKIDKLQDITQAIRRIGKELDAEGQASALALQLLAELDALRQKTHKLSPKKVFLALSHTPGDMTGIMTTGPGTFLHELIELGGGRNLFADTSLLYPQISKETLLMRQPDVIIEIFAAGISSQNQVLLRKDWMRLSTLSAVRQGNIHFLTDDYLLIPGVRIAQTATKLAKIIHPEVFHE